MHARHSYGRDSFCCCHESAEVCLITCLQSLSTSAHALESMRGQCQLSNRRCRHCQIRKFADHARKTRQRAEPLARSSARVHSVPEQSSNAKPRTRRPDLEIAFCSEFRHAEDRMIRRAERLMSVQQENRTVVGLAGVPGSGKSTVAENVVNKCVHSKDHKHICFLFDARAYNAHHICSWPEQQHVALSAGPGGHRMQVEHLT